MYRPRVVLCFGLQTYNAICHALGRPGCKLLRNAVRSPVRWGGTRIACLPHPGVYGDMDLRRRGYSSDFFWRRLARRSGY